MSTPKHRTAPGSSYFVTTKCWQGRIHKLRNQKSEIWQVGFHGWTIHDLKDWKVRAEYIRDNPVRAKLVQTPQDWPYSSASGRFTIDPTPAKFHELSSGAKAQDAQVAAPGLKPRPPK